MQSPHARSVQQQAMRFAGLSGLSFVSSLGITALLHEAMGLPSAVAVLIAMACVTVMNFCGLRLLVFEPGPRGWCRQFAGFVVSIAGFRAAEFGAFVLVHGVLAVPYLPAYALILLASMIGKFLYLRVLIFQPAAATEVTS